MFSAWQYTVRQSEQYDPTGASPSAPATLALQFVSGCAAVRLLPNWRRLATEMDLDVMLGWIRSNLVSFHLPHSRQLLQTFLVSKLPIRHYSHQVEVNLPVSISRLDYARYLHKYAEKGGSTAVHM